MPVFADVLPEPSIDFPIDVYSSSASYVAPNFFYSLLRV